MSTIKKQIFQRCLSKLMGAKCGCLRTAYRCLWGTAETSAEGISIYTYIHPNPKISREEIYVFDSWLTWEG